MRGRTRLAAAVWAFGAVLAACPCAGQEQVRVQVPASVTFHIPDLGSKASAPPSRLSFDHALLAPGSRLRISVQAEGLDLTGTGAPARISFAARGARGGTGFNGQLQDADFLPVFESAPHALSGSVELAWTVEPLGRVERSGTRPVTLRWKVESIPGAMGPPPGGSRVQRPLKPGDGSGPIPPGGSRRRESPDPAGREAPRLEPPAPGPSLAQDGFRPRGAICACHCGGWASMRNLVGQTLTA